MKKTWKTLLNICLSSCALFYPMDNLVSLITSAETYNERHVQTQLNNVIPTTADLVAVITEINALPASEQRRALNALSGEQYTNLVQTNQVASQQFMRRMYDSVRFDSLGLCCGQNCDQYEVWSAVGGGEAYQSHSHGAKGFKLSDFNVYVGALKPLNFTFLNSWLTVGVAGSYERDEIKFSQRGHGKANNWQGSIYYLWSNCRFYSFSATIIGSDCIRIKRPLHFAEDHRRARSKAYLTQWTSYSEAGLNFNWDCIYIQPFVGIEYAFYRRHALSERHARSVGLHVRGKNISATIGRLGAHLTTNLPWYGLLVSADIAWRTRFNFLQERIKTRFKEFGTNFRIKGVHQKPNGIEGALNISKIFCDCLETYVEVSGEKWDRYSAWNVAGGVGVTW
jgi:outer membrane autotransporter protein